MRRNFSLLDNRDFTFNPTTMKIALIFLMLFLGFILTFHLSMNAQVGALVKNPKMANALFWCIGAVMAIIIGFTGWDSEFFTKLKDVPLWLLTAGAMGG